MSILTFDFLLSSDVMVTALIVVLLTISIFLYKKCQKKVFQRPKPIIGFWKKYWYDMKCTYLVVAFGVPSSLIGAEFIKWIST